MGLYCSIVRTKVCTRQTPDVFDDSRTAPYGESHEIHYWHRNHNGVHSHMWRVYMERGGKDPEFNNKVIDLDEGELLSLAKHITENFVLGFVHFEDSKELGDLLDGIKEAIKWVELGWFVHYRCNA